MSIYKSSSLAMIPTAYKDGKLYSVRPTDGGGDFTFSRGSNLAATRVASSGYIEKGRENVLLQSNQFDTTWTATNITATSGQTGYDGTTDAWLLTKIVANGNISQSVSASNLMTFSVYAKASANDWLRLNVVGVANAYFDLANGVVGSTGGAAAVTSAMVDAGGDWYRCSFTYNVASTTGVSIYVADADNDSSGTSGSIFIQDAQLEAGLVATDYIETGATSVSAGILEDMPRLDYSGSCPALLLEPQRTNLLTQSELFSGWSTIQNATITNNNLSSLEGLQNAAKITDDSTSGNHRVFQSVTTSAASHTFSMFLKKGTMTTAFLRFHSSSDIATANVDLDAGTITATAGSATIEDYGNDWYRCSITGTAVAGTSYVYVYMKQLAGYSGSGQDMYLYGAQVEAGSYPTSLIPTYGASVTRSKDVCNKTGISDLIGQTQGTMFFEIDQPYADGVNGAWSISDGSSSNRVTMNTLDVNASTFTLSIAANYAGGSTNVISTNTTYGLHKVAIQYTDTTLKIFVDGAEATSGSTDGFGNYTNFYLGANQVGTGADEIREFKQAVLFPTALTDSECIALTTI